MTRINVTTSDLEETNLFLRALWARLRTDFGRCGWQHIPMRDGQAHRIDFGFADIGGTVLRVGVFYKTRSTLSSVYFCGPDDASPLEPTLLKRLENAVRLSQQEFRNPKAHYFKLLLYVKPGLRIATYEGAGIRLEQTARGEVTLTSQTKGFDLLDARSEFLRNAHTLVDVLTTLTEVHFDLEKTEYHPNLVAREVSRIPPSERTMRERVRDRLRFKSQQLRKILKNRRDARRQAPVNEFFTGEWLDERESDDVFVKLSLPGWRLIERITSGSPLSEKAQAFTNACAHFRVGRLFERWLYAGGPVHNINTNLNELVTVAYVSALEVAAAIDAEAPQACDKCGQPVYSISKRVHDAVEQRLGEWTAQRIKKIYGHRSKYLHAGKLFSNRGNVGNVIPQIDPADETGCTPASAGVSALDLREVTGHVLRDVLSSLQL